MWEFYVALGVIAFVWFCFVRPRYIVGGKDGPAVVTTSSSVPIPFIGVIAEFLKGPNDMMKRCYDDYGSVFTIPVRARNFVLKTLRKGILIETEFQFLHFL